MKKLVSLLLALALVLGCVSALAETNLSRYTSDPAEKITIAWLAGHDTEPIEEDNPVPQWLEEKFNVEFDVWFLERENYDELLTTRIIGGEIPDVFMLQDATQFAKYVKQGVVMELPLEVVQQCMPESYEWLIEYDPDCFSAVSYDGKNYGLPRRQRRRPLQLRALLARRLAGQVRLHRRQCADDA